MMNAQINPIEIFCYQHGQTKYNGKCSRCIWAGEKTPNEIAAAANSKTPEQQRAVLMAALGFK